MIKQEYYKTRNDGVRLIKTYSDSNKYIIQVETGIEYDVAIDVFPLRYTYIESDKDIEAENNENI
jgi:hypothetical protein